MRWAIRFARIGFFESNRVRARELYDHSNDPDETVNIATENQTTIRQLQKQMNELVDHSKIQPGN